MWTLLIVAVLLLSAILIGFFYVEDQSGKHKRIARHITRLERMGLVETRYIIMKTRYAKYFTSSIGPR